MAPRGVGSKIAGALAQAPRGGGQMQRVSPGVYRDASGNLVRGNGAAQSARNSAMQGAAQGAGAARQPARNPYSPAQMDMVRGIAQGAGAAFGSQQIPQDKMYRFPQGGGMATGIVADAQPQGGGYGNPWQSAMQGAAYGAQAGGQMLPTEMDQMRTQDMPQGPNRFMPGSIDQIMYDKFRGMNPQRGGMAQAIGNAQPQGGGMSPYDQQFAAQQAGFAAGQAAGMQPQGGGYGQMQQQAIQGAAQGMNPMMRKF